MNSQILVYIVLGVTAMIYAFFLNTKKEKRLRVNTHRQVLLLALAS